ncbi:MAG TPA: MotA/TolQ/ExbB proton channel family protein [Anaerohalosphaeraceae bacterium]|nr:MotA/TolQ/ExbB proton channel family protein [Anaerohalosphaeraceae bacterium]
MTTGLGVMEAPSWFDRFFLAGGPIVWFVLLPMSAAMLALGLDLGFRLRRKVLLPNSRAGQIAALAGQYGLLGLEARLKGSPDFLGRAILWALSQNRKKGFDFGLVREAAADSLREQGLDLMRRAEGCHLIGTVAPMVGLFGTVFGMIQAFIVLGASEGQPRPDQLAQSISVALVTTFWGLLVAIPALVLHGFFRMRIESLMGQAAFEMEALLERLAEMGCFRKGPSNIHEEPTRTPIAEEMESSDEEDDEPLELEFEADE